MAVAKSSIEHLWRFDYVKFTFPDADPQASAKRFKRITDYVNEHMGDSPVGSWREPKQTFLSPHYTRPNGYHIVEIWGEAAGAVIRFPWAWVEHMTYAHVKTYADMPEGEDYNSLLDYFNNAGFRKATRITPRRQRHSKKDSKRPGLQVGSKKSSLHFGIYVRPYERVGVEGRFRDEHLATARDFAVLATDEPTNPKVRDGYLMLLRFLAQKTQDQLDYEFLSRDREIADFLTGFSRTRRSVWSQQFHGEMLPPEPIAEEPEAMYDEDHEA